MKIYVIRHGQTNWNKERKIQGHTDIELNEEGIKQAERAYEDIRKLEIDLVISSPLKRTRKTAEIITEGRNCPIMYDESLIERGFGTLEGVVITTQMEEKIKKNYNFYYESSDKTIESVKQLLDRVGGFLDKIKKEYRGKNILLVTHGGVIRAIETYFNGISENGDLGTGIIKNCEIREYEFK